MYIDIGFWTLKVKCTYLGLWISNLQECKGNLDYQTSGGASGCF